MDYLIEEVLMELNYVDGTSVGDQKLQYITPIIGVNYKNFMFAYTYSHLTGDVKFDNGGFHQITLGINLFCKKIDTNVIVLQLTNLINLKYSPVCLKTGFFLI